MIRLPLDEAKATRWAWLLDALAVVACLILLDQSRPSIVKSCTHARTHARTHAKLEDVVGRAGFTQLLELPGFADALNPAYCFGDPP